MTTKGHSLKEPSIRLFLSNRHKKPGESLAPGYFKQLTITVCNQ